MPYQSPAIVSRIATHTPSNAAGWGGAVLLVAAALAASLFYFQGKKRATQRG